MIYVWCVIKIFIVNPLTWLAKHPKALIVVVVIAGGLYGYQACNRPVNQTPKQQQVSAQVAKAPTVQQAPDALQTYTRTYYVASFTKVSEQKVILFKWYEWNGKDWVYQNSTEGVPFDKKLTGDWRMFRR